MNRRTSVYTLHLEDHTTTKAIAHGFPTALQDQGETSLSFRARDDQDARQIAADALAGLDDPYTLTTGLGVHRRTVTTQGATS